MFSCFKFVAIAFLTCQFVDNFEPVLSANSTTDRPEDDYDKALDKVNDMLESLADALKNAQDSIELQMAELHASVNLVHSNLISNLDSINSDYLQDLVSLESDPVAEGMFDMNVTDCMGNSTAVLNNLTTRLSQNMTTCFGGKIQEAEDYMNDTIYTMNILLNVLYDIRYKLDDCLDNIDTTIANECIKEQVGNATKAFQEYLNNYTLSIKETGLYLSVAKIDLSTCGEDEKAELTKVGGEVLLKVTTCVKTMVKTYSHVTHKLQHITTTMTPEIIVSTTPSSGEYITYFRCGALQLLTIVLMIVIK